MFLTSDEKESTLKTALNMLVSIFPDTAFFGKQEPEVIMTDNNDEIRNTIKEVWPNSKLLLCTFHVLQQVWRWLFDKDHNVDKNDRVQIMRDFRGLLHETNETKFMERHN